jgi:hypothetical protein
LALRRQVADQRQFETGAGIDRSGGVAAAAQRIAQAQRASPSSPRTTAQGAGAAAGGGMQKLRIAKL